MCKRVADGIHTSKANQKLNLSKNKNKENKMYVTYKSLNQRMSGEVSISNSNMIASRDNKNGEYRQKIVSMANYRTKQNSPHKRATSSDTVEVSL